MSSDLVSKTAAMVKQRLEGEATGHDWWHVFRVWQVAKRIAKDEPSANLLIVELGALLHDIADWKFSGGDLEAGPKAAREWLSANGVNEDVIVHVEDIIRDTPFKGAAVALRLKTIEAKIVFDADKLDAIGAIGIARAFAYGGNQNRSLYEPDKKPSPAATFEQYKTNQSHTINHFYEKLLLLKDRMQTDTGKKMALARHQFMKNYLQEFYDEWDGKH